jgi:hypothetical protein
LRDRRDAGWSIIRRRHVDGLGVPEDEIADFSQSGAIAEEFEVAIRAADVAADRRFEHAGAAAQLAVIGRQISEQNDLLESLGLEEEALTQERATSEARDLGEVDRFSFYDRTKIYTAAPPDVLRVDEKNLREYYAFNCLGFIITTNHKTDGIYLPADDRRRFVAWSQRTKDEFYPQYWNELWGWYQSGGFGHVAAYLTEFDLAGFDAKAPPPKTAAFWDIVNANGAPEDAELADVLEALGNPVALTLGQLIDGAMGTEAADWLMDRRNRRAIPHRMERCGYAPVRNPDAADGRWKLQDRRQVVYAKASLSLRDQIAAARRLGGGT